MDLLEVSRPPQPTELFYDSIFIKFDPECVEHESVNLKEHFSSALRGARHSPIRTKSSAAFASVPEEQRPRLKNVQLPDAEKFSELLDLQLPTAARLFAPSPEEDADRSDTKIQAAVPPRRLSETAVRRLLGQVPQAQREAEILASLHLLAASHLVGDELASQALEMEAAGNYSALLDFIRDHKQVQVSAEAIEALRKKVSATSSPSRRFQDLSAQQQTPAPVLPLITRAEQLATLGIRIVKNPLLEADLLKLANLLPCIAFEAEPDRSKVALGEFLPMASAARSLQLADPAKRKELPVLQDQIDASNFQEDSEKEGFLASNDKFSPSLKYTLLAPDDAHFDAQWYLM